MDSKPILEVVRLQTPTESSKNVIKDHHVVLIQEISSMAVMLLVLAHSTKSILNYLSK